MSDAEEGAAPEEEKKYAAEAGGVEVGGGGIPPKVDMTKRFLASLIDGIIMAVIGGVGAVVGGIVGGIAGGMIGGFVTGAGQLAGGGYYLLKDSLNDGRSYGKKFQGLTIQTPDGTPCTQQQSMQRNSVLAAPSLIGGVASLFGGIPVIGALIGMGAGLLAMLVSLGGLYESIQVVALDPNGRRMMELKSQAYTVLE